MAILPSSCLGVRYLSDRRAREAIGDEKGLRQKAMNESDLKTLLSERIQAVQERIETACRRAGRARAEVTLVAVTKTVGPEIAALLLSLGITDLGESRPQELWRKAAALPATVKWHLVGHL